MRRICAVAAGLVLVATACMAGEDTASRTILVDHSHDEFSSYFIKFFPTRLTVAQGDELVFRQTWTGEPHTVTGGKHADELGVLMRPFLQDLREGKPLMGSGPPKEIMEAEERIGFATGEEGALNQTLAQPCYLKTGETDKKGKPCPNQRQPVFDGTHNVYNSGIIPYEGPQGNEYRVQLAEDIKPGNYFFYCAVHGGLQSSEVEVKAKGEDVPSPEENSRAARSEINAMAKPLLKLFRDAEESDELTFEGPEGEEVEVERPYAGLFKPPVWQAGINEFIPRRQTVEAGEQIEWSLLGAHTISFGVPEYFPIIEFEEDGTLKRNERLDPPAGGANPFEMTEEERYDEERTEAVEFDGGTYDGSGFWSSGLIDADPYIRYTMRISKPGTYKYACLVHPPMVGTAEVT